MTNKQRRILEDAEISSELMHEVDHYLKDVGAVLSGTIHEKENYLTMLCNDIAEFVDVNPSASINNINYWRIRYAGKACGCFSRK